MKAATVMLAGMLAACTVGPDYTPPKPALPANWTEHAATPAEIARTDQQLKKWWASFNDPTLDRLVDTALANNLDLKIASQRLIGARAARVIAASADYPQIDAGAIASDKQASNTVLFPPVDWDRSNYQFYQLGSMQPGKLTFSAASGVRSRQRKPTTMPRSRRGAPSWSACWRNSRPTTPRCGPVRNVFRSPTAMWLPRAGRSN